MITRLNLGPWFARAAGSVSKSMARYVSGSETAAWLASVAQRLEYAWALNKR